MLKVSVHPLRQTQVYEILLCMAHLLKSIRDMGILTAGLEINYECMYGWVMDAYFIYLVPCINLVQIGRPG